MLNNLDISSRRYGNRTSTTQDLGISLNIDSRCHYLSMVGASVLVATLRPNGTGSILGDGAGATGLLTTQEAFHVSNTMPPQPIQVSIIPSQNKAISFVGSCLLGMHEQHGAKKI